MTVDLNWFYNILTILPPPPKKEKKKKCQTTSVLFPRKLRTCWVICSRGNLLPYADRYPAVKSSEDLSQNSGGS